MREWHGTYFARRGIAGRRRKRDARWEKTKDGLFVVCPACGEINQVEDPDVGPSGKLCDCAHCPKCGAHPFFVLEGWKGPCLVFCVECGLEAHVKKASRRLPRGWKLTSAGVRGCRKKCCQGYYCPLCVEELELGGDP